MPFYDNRKKPDRRQKLERDWQDDRRAGRNDRRSSGGRKDAQKSYAGYRSEPPRGAGRDHYPADRRFTKDGSAGRPDGRNGRRPEKRMPKPGSEQSRSSRGQEWAPAPRPEAAFRPQPAPEPRRYGPNGEFDTPYSREPENLLSGRNPIREALKADRDIEKLLVAKGDLTGSAREIISLARQKGIPVQVVERSRLDEITPHHQGVLAYASAYQYSTVDSMLALAREKGEAPFLVVLDGITDPHNLGAIIRTAACVGAHGVIVPMRRAAGLTPAAVKASAGAVETIKVARVTNLVNTLKALKQQGIWVYAADMEGEDYRTLRMEAPMALLIGSEGEGISRLALEQADHKVKLPMYGGVESLNASVAAGVLMYAAVRNR